MLFENFVDLFLDSAPWLLLGLVLAGLLKVFVPMAWMQKQLGGHGPKTVIKAALLGAPLPLCSCGVIPAAVGLRRSGASKAATTSFLVSTPETGVDSIAVSYVLLGPFMAVVRPIAAVSSAIVAGLLVGRDDDDGKAVKADADVKGTEPAASCCAPAVKSETAKSCCSSAKEPLVAPVKAASCCGSKGDNHANVAMTMTPVTAPSLMTPHKLSAAENTKTTSCCGSKSSSIKASSVSAIPAMAEESGAKECTTEDKPAKIVVVKKGACCDSKPNLATETGDSCCASTQDMATELKSESIVKRVGIGLHYAATDLVRDTTLWLLVGLFFAALVQTYVPADFLAKWGDGILAMLVMVLVSVPMYICATASTPIAAGLLLAGVSPGAVLVFMLAGPATNIATLGVVTKELGKRALFGYLGGVLGVALVAGVLVNYLVDTFGFVVMPQIGEEHQMLPHWLVISASVVLAILMAKAILEKLPRSWLRRSDCCS